MRIELDHTASICESDGTDNETCVNKTVDIPDLVVDSAASSITCISDGSLTGTTVTVSNTGCGDATGVVVRLASDCGLTFSDQTVNLAAGATEDVFFPFTAGITDCTCTFTAEIDPDDAIFECDGTNNSGSSGNTVNQWTQNFTGVNIPSAGGTQTFTIQSHDITTNFCTTSTNCMVSILMEADYNNTICEWGGTDNTYSTNKTSDCLDLEATSINVSTPCASDGSLTSTLSVTVTNSGGNPITEDFSIRVDDGNGWTSELRYNADLGGPLPFAAGASAAPSFDWNRDFDAANCNFATITMQVDSQNEICQCTIDNDITTINHELSHPNLEPTDITPSCSGDGYYVVAITMENNGCGDVSAGDGRFTVHLEDNLGNSNDKTVDLENNLAKGESITIEFTQWPATCNPNTVTFTATVDYNDDVCEMDGQDNVMTFTFSNPAPDLEFTNVTSSTICPSPGDVRGKIEMTILNNGNTPITGDFKITIDDGEGWSKELYYNADLNGELPIAVGESVTIPVKWDRDFTKTPFKCNFNNMKVSLDIGISICECGKDNNETVTTYRIPYPDLTVQSLMPTCDKDGMRRMQVTISNEGCDHQGDDFTVNFSDSTGQSRNITFTALGGTLPLRAGTSQTLTFSQMEFDCSTGSMEYTVTVAPENNIADLSAGNNTLTTTYSANEPDLLFDDIDWTCNADGTITFSITVANKGFGDADNVPVRVYDESGKLIFSQTIDVLAGGQSQLSFTTETFPENENLTFRFVVDEDREVCECNGMNNEKSTTIKCEGGEPRKRNGVRYFICSGDVSNR